MKSVHPTPDNRLSGQKDLMSPGVTGPSAILLIAGKAEVANPTSVRLSHFSLNWGLGWDGALGVLLLWLAEAESHPRLAFLRRDKPSTPAQRSRSAGRPVRADLDFRFPVRFVALALLKSSRAIRR
jgi:hypothetical protein